MSRTLTASDRSALIRLASTMPAGSAERRSILAALSNNRIGQRVNLPDFVEEFINGNNLDLFGPEVSVQQWADAMIAADAAEYNNFDVNEVAGWLPSLGVKKVHPAREHSVALYFELPAKAPLNKIMSPAAADEVSTIDGGPTGQVLDANWVTRRPPYTATRAALAEGRTVWVRMWWD